MGNLELRKKSDVSPFRKMAIGTWQNAYDPTVYGSMSVRMERALEYVEQFRAATGKHLTITHMMAKAAAAVLEAIPDANAILRWNRIYLRQRIGVFFQVVMEDPDTGEIDLSGTVIYDPEQKTLGEIVDEFNAKVKRVKKGADKKLQGSRNMFRRVPYALLNRLLKLISFVSYTLNLDLRWAGVPNDPFGSMMITNIGSLGLQEAYVPLVPYSRVPLLVAMGAVEDVPVVEDDRVVPGKVMRICATFDHRVLDGAHAAVMSPRPARVAGAPIRSLRTDSRQRTHPLNSFRPAAPSLDPREREAQIRASERRSCTSRSDPREREARLHEQIGSARARGAAAQADRIRASKRRSCASRSDPREQEAQLHKQIGSARARGAAARAYRAAPLQRARERVETRDRVSEAVRLEMPRRCVSRSRGNP